MSESCIEEDTRVSCAVLIGNSDNKLSQEDWASFMRTAMDLLHSYSKIWHFTGYSNPVVPWQNACFVFDMWIDQLEDVRKDLARLARQFHQDSIAILWGDTEFVKREDGEDGI